MASLSKASATAPRWTTSRCITTWTTALSSLGGTVNARHVVLVGNADDSLDWTDGWTGSIQYLHIVQAASAGRQHDRSRQSRRQRAGDSHLRALHRQHDDARQVGRTRHAPAPRHGLHLYNSVVSGSERCLRVQGESLNHLGTRNRVPRRGAQLPDHQRRRRRSRGAGVSRRCCERHSGRCRPEPSDAASAIRRRRQHHRGFQRPSWGTGWTVGVQ